MTERQLFEAIGEVDDALVLWAARPRVHQSARRLIAVAAAAAIVIGSLCAFVLWQRGRAGSLPMQQPGVSTTVSTPTTTTPTTEPPLKTAPGGLPWLTGTEIVSGGVQGLYGWESAWDISELLLVSEWEAVPATVPVWRVSNDFNSSFDLQKGLIRRFTSLFGEGEIADDAFTTVEGSDSRESIDGGRGTFLETERYRYSVSSDHPYVVVWPHNPMEVKEDVDWVELLRSIAPKLVEDMERPALRVTGGGRTPIYTEDGALKVSDRYFWVRIYDAAEKGGCAPGLKGVELYVEDSMLKGVHIYLDEYYEIVGDYPTISEAEAQQLLSEYCNTLQQYGQQGMVEGKVLRTEIAYISHSLSRLRVPFYRFLLEVPQEAQNPTITESGLKGYREIYVSAVPKEYWSAGSNEVCYG